MSDAASVPEEDPAAVPDGERLVLPQYEADLEGSGERPTPLTEDELRDGGEREEALDDRVWNEEE